MATDGGNTDRTTSQVRAGRNESLFRKVNERIESVRGSTSSFVEFICECSDDSCVLPVPMTLTEYEGVRAVPTHFAIRVGHDVPEADRVVGGAHDRYVVVEKIGAAGAVAAGLDPRS